MFKTSFKVFVALSFIMSIISCSNKDSYSITKNKVGLVNTKTTVSEIDAIFEKDSVVKHLSEGILGYQGRYSQEDDYYLIYSNTGKHLLTLTPNEPLDSLSTMRYVEIHDGLYTTLAGVGLNSTFEEINLSEQISKVEATFTKVVLYLDALNATMTLNKTELGINTIQVNDVQLEQIPNLVKPQSFVVWFD
tara:strand:+ start:23091 stop:23663 length:573 start_codon:yes stop_codon:yes gene_type:complete